MRSPSITRPQALSSELLSKFLGTCLFFVLCCIASPADRVETGDDSFPSEDDLFKSVYKFFDFSKLRTGVNTRALACAISAATGTETPPTLTLLAVGSFNLVILATFPNGRTAITRIPFKSSYTQGKMASVVATMTYARCIVDIPCPEVYAWNDDKQNPVNTAYIVMSEVKGAQLGYYWIGLSPDARLAVVKEVAKLHARLCNARFPFDGFGTIQFAPDVTRSDSDIFVDIHNPASYSLGAPRWPTDAFPRDGVEFSPKIEPESDIRKLWLSTWRSEVVRMFHLWHTMNQMDDMKTKASLAVLFDGIVPSIDDLKHYANCVRNLFENCNLPPNASDPALCHGDFAFRNILINPESNGVVGIVDWDRCSVMPFLAATSFPEDLCVHLGSQAWEQRGAFKFLPDESILDSEVNPDSEEQQLTFEGRYGQYIAISREEAGKFATWRREYEKCFLTHNEHITATSWAFRSSILVADYLAQGGFATWIRARGWFDTYPNEARAGRYGLPNDIKKTSLTATNVEGARESIFSHDSYAIINASDIVNSITRGSRCIGSVHIEDCAYCGMYPNLAVAHAAIDDVLSLPLSRSSRPHSAPPPSPPPPPPAGKAVSSSQSLPLLSEKAQNGDGHLGRLGRFVSAIFRLRWGPFRPSPSRLVIGGAPSHSHADRILPSPPDRGHPSSLPSPHPVLHQRSVL